MTDTAPPLPEPVPDTISSDPGKWPMFSAEQITERDNWFLERLRAAEAPKWIPVSERMPPCDGERVFVGVNSAGYAACFNHINPDGTCVMGSAEACTAQMSELMLWYELNWPVAAHEQWRNIQRRAMGSTTSGEAPHADST